MSSRIHSSADFIWSEEDLLGRGAYGNVYKGRHKTQGDGQMYAIKTFNSHSTNYVPADVRERELDVLRKLDHENIVRLLAVQTDEKVNQKVLITELCTGGSLFDLLDDPENRLGMEENEFISVLHDLAAGMQHLRDQGVVHRDIKPGNIMRYITEDGRSIYKLIDFGAARELETGGEFQSLVGTPEYLFPDMYECAMLKRQNTTNFGAAVDLWSVGVTLYHVASGALPFLPYEGGRNNPHMMHKMSTEKAPGVISGIQRTAGGKIEWSRELPKTCRLSRGLQSLVTPLLADLLQPKQEQSLPFDEFFARADQVKSKIVVYVFYVNTCEMLHIFCSKDTELSQFQELITAQTNVATTNQILIYENHKIDRIIKPRQTVESYPGRILLNPIFLLVENCQEEKTSNLTKPLVDIATNAGRPGPFDMDVALSKNMCAMAYNVRRCTADIIGKQQFICKAMRMYLLICSRQVKVFRDEIVEVALRVAEIEKRLQLFADSQNQMASITAAVSKLSDKKVDSGAHFISHAKQQEHFLRLKQQMDKMKEKGEELVETVEHNLTEGVSSLEQNACQDTNNCLAKLDILTSEMRATMEVFKKQLSEKKAMTQLEKMIHMIDQSKLKSNLKKADKQCHGHCLPNLQEIYRRFLIWWKQVEEVQNVMRYCEDETEMALTRVTYVTRELDQKCAERNSGMKSLMTDLGIADVPLTDMTRSTSQLDFSYTGSASNQFEFRLKKKTKAGRPSTGSSTTRESTTVSPPVASDVPDNTRPATTGHGQSEYVVFQVQNNDDTDQGTLRFDNSKVQ